MMEEDTSSKRLTTARVASSGDVVERPRKERIVDLHGYHDANRQSEKRLHTRGFINPEVMNMSAPPPEIKIYCIITTHQLYSYHGQVAHR
jgi:hypothetical protein